MANPEHLQILELDNRAWAFPLHPEHKGAVS
jgi:hypothetical protein